jgi:hypothetical protein
MGLKRHGLGFGRIRSGAVILGWFAGALWAPRTLPAQQGSTSPPASVQEELETLKKEVASLREELNKLKERDSAATQREIESLRAELNKLKGQEPAPTQEDVRELAKETQQLKERVEAVEPGQTGFLVTGYGFAGFIDEEGEPSTFNAGFNPIFLWRAGERIFAEAEVHFGLDDDETEVELEYADLNYILNDYMTVGAGLFLAPFGNFAERFHPAWINKLPDAPLAFGHDGLAPHHLLGIQLRGAIPISQTKLTYALTLTNGPRLNPGEAGDPDEAGMLHFDNFEDIRHGKAVGARVGFLPIPELELSYSVIFADVNMPDDDLDHVDATLHSVDLNYVRDAEFLSGTIDFKAQWVWSLVDRTTYDPTGALGFGPLSFSNRRHGGYVQLAYRPSKLEIDFLRNLEAIVRFDAVDLPRNAPTNVDERRWTVGLDYWISPSMVVKVAYRFDDRDDPAGVEEDRDALLVQFGLGF